MRIVLNYDTRPRRIEITSEQFSTHDKTLYWTVGAPAFISNLESVVEHILNGLDYSRLSSASKTFDIKLIRLEDGKEKLIGEW